MAITIIHNDIIQSMNAGFVSALVMLDLRATLIPLITMCSSRLNSIGCNLIILGTHRNSRYKTAAPAWLHSPACSTGYSHRPRGIRRLHGDIVWDQWQVRRQPPSIRRQLKAAYAVMKHRQWLEMCRTPQRQVLVMAATTQLAQNRTDRVRLSIQPYEV